MKRYTVSFIVIVIAIAVPFLLIHPNDRSAMSGNGRVTQQILNDAIVDAIRIAERTTINRSRIAVRCSAVQSRRAGVLNDPYTYYVTQTEHQRAIENLYNAQFGGLGIHLYYDIKALSRVLNPFRTRPLHLRTSKPEITLPKSMANDFI